MSFLQAYLRPAIDLSVAAQLCRYKAVEASSYDTRAPERQTITMTRLNAAGQRLGGEVVDITLSNLRGCGPEETSSSGSNQFCTSELYRQVCQGCQHKQ